MSANAVPATPPDPHDTAPPLAADAAQFYDGGMDHRLTVLETRFDTILPTLLRREEFFRVMAEQRAETAAQFDRMRAETAAQFDRMRAETAAQVDRMRAETAAQVDRLRAETAAQIDKLRAETAVQFDSLRTETTKLRADVNATVLNAMRWMIGLTITLIVAISGFGLALFHSTRMMALQYERNAIAAPQLPSATIAPPAQRR